MRKQWLAIFTGVALTLGVGIIALNYDKPVQPRPTGESASKIPTQSNQNVTEKDASYSPAHPPLSEAKFESQSERIEAQVLAELDRLNQDIAKQKQSLDKETAEAQAQETSPELVLAEASRILSQLEDEGITLTYEPILLTPNRPSQQVQNIEKQLIEIEGDLIEVENKFNNLGNNKKESE